MSTDMSIERTRLRAKPVTHTEVVPVRVSLDPKVRTRPDPYRSKDGWYFVAEAERWVREEEIAEYVAYSERARQAELLREAQINFPVQWKWEWWR
jgi:hypothetical protein